MSLRAGLLALAFALATVVIVPLAAEGDAGVYHWRGQGERVLVVENNLGPEWQTALTQAVAMWSSTPEVQLVIGPPGADCWDFDAAIEVCEAFPETAVSWIGLSSVFKNAEGHITRVFAEVNERKAWGPAKRLYVLCHELGHALGLRHRASLTYLPSCMVPAFKYAMRPIGIDATDRADVAAMYAHADPPPSPSVSPSPSPSVSPSPSSPSVSPSPSPSDSPSPSPSSSATVSPPVIQPALRGFRPRPA